ncbi:hypothetical protein HALA3H3_210038 [Halomonas sp. A3H3]|nr:hypothetical protein HALA3H3_210038 [Halomonas sp. A3H3]
MILKSAGSVIMALKGAAAVVLLIGYQYVLYVIHFYVYYYPYVKPDLNFLTIF